MELSLPIALLVQQGIDLLLVLDPPTRAALERLEGKVMRFEIEQPDLVVTLSVTDREVQVLRHFDGEVDVTLVGVLTAMLSLRSGNDALFKGDVKLAGDLGVAQILAEIIAAIDVDWEELTSKVTGDLVAHRMGNVARDFSDWSERAASSFRDNTSDYLQEEIQVVASRAEVDAFSEDVSELRSDTDRLEARIARLEEKATGE